uniref:RING-type domain-containing protein n=1 Tax=Panagrolaimus davidi TaxID=227884 RepID=A0A914P6Z0_9BILA
MAERNYETEKVKKELAERNCEDEKVKREMAERNYEREVEKIKSAERALEKENAKQKKNIKKLQNKLKKESGINKEMCKILNEKADEAKMLLNCYEKLKAASTEVLQNNRSLKMEISEAEENARKTKSEKEKLSLDLTKAVENSDNIKRKIPRKYKLRRKNGSRYIPYELSAARTRRRKVQNAVQGLKAVPDMAEKVLSRFKTKSEAIKRKINPLQAVTMAAITGLNCNQMENMKTFLRFFDIDVLPPVHKMRETLKMLKEEFKYEEFENIELGVVGRRVQDIREVVAKRGKRLMENQKWVDVPGLEAFAFVGLTCDSGGNFLHAAISMMNVDEGWGSPNNATLVATGKVPKENYETVECVCGKSFHQINQLDRTEIKFEVNGITVTKTVIVIVCLDGKMSSICSGHCGSSSAMPCYDCVSTKKDINEGKIGELRNAETMLRQAKQFEEKKKSLKNPSEAVLSKLRYECECITKRPLLTMSHTQWIYGILHAAMGPVIKVLDTIEDDALKQDLKDLKINIQSSAEIRKSNKNLKTEIENVKSHIEELKNAIKTSKLILPKWKKIRRTPMKDQPICESPYCVQNLFGTDPSPLFLTFLKCKCGSFIHASCDLLFVNYEIQYAQDTEYLCPSCDPISTEGALKDLEARQAEWEKDLTELKEIIKKKEQELKDTKVEIPYERCVTYQKIQSQLKELKVRKNLYFQKLNGVDVRKLITHRETFISVIKEDFQEDVRSLFTCLNTFQELAEKQFLTDADIDMIDSSELKRAYKVIE